MLLFLHYLKVILEWLIQVWMSTLRSDIWSVGSQMEFLIYSFCAISEPEKCVVVCHQYRFLNFHFPKSFCSLRTASSHREQRSRYHFFFSLVTSNRTWGNWMDIRKSFFSNRVLGHWKRLPRAVVTTLSLLEVKKGLDNRHTVWFLGSPMWNHELDSIIFVGSF